MENVVRHLHRMVGRNGAGLDSDEQLLERFFVSGDQEAFGLIVRRHGPLVFGVCMRVLHHRHNAEDAFQATFLALVRKGNAIRQPGALPSWLYRVAFRVALRLKANSDKRSADVLTEVPVDADPGAAAAWRELRPVLDSELHKLPAKYRTPMILCYLEGKTYEEVAGELGCPKGTVAIRLLRGRLMLKNRLVRRGLLTAAGWVGANAALPCAMAHPPVAVAASTINACGAVALGSALGSVVPASVAALAQSAGEQLGLAKIWATAICMVGVGLATVGLTTSGVLGRSSTGPSVTIADSLRTEATSQASPAPWVEPQLRPAQPSVAHKPPEPRLPEQKAQNNQIIVAGLSEENLPCRYPPNCRTTTVIVVSSQRTCTGLAWREQAGDNVENPRSVRIIMVTGSKKPGTRAFVTEVLRVFVITRA